MDVCIIIIINHPIAWNMAPEAACTFECAERRNDRSFMRRQRKSYLSPSAVQSTVAQRNMESFCLSVQLQFRAVVEHPFTSDRLFTKMKKHWQNFHTCVVFVERSFNVKTRRDRRRRGSRKRRWALPRAPLSVGYHCCSHDLRRNRFRTHVSLKVMSLRRLIFERERRQWFGW